MHVAVTTPADPIVTWVEADAHLRLSGDTDQQEYVEALIASATTWLEGPAGYLSRSLGVQILELRTAAFCTKPLQLPYGPVTSLDAVSYLDADGVEQDADAALFELLTDGRVALSSGSSWPATLTNEEAVRFVYQAGYETVPAPIKTAILLMVAYLFEHREASLEDAFSKGAAASLVAPYRVWSI